MSADVGSRERIQLAAKSTEFRLPLRSPTHQAVVRNLACGDEIKVSLQVHEGVIQDLSAQITGCLVTSAAWTMLASTLIGKPCHISLALLDQLCQFLDQKTELLSEELTDLRGFRRPSPRRECAKLPALAVLRSFISPTPAEKV